MTTKINLKNKKLYTDLNGIWLLIGLGIFFILIQFFQDRGLWMDEANLASSIRDANFYELFKPFGNGQVAPILYLIIQKGLIWIFGSYDLVFRILPLVSILLSALLFFLY